MMQDKIMTHTGTAATEEQIVIYLVFLLGRASASQNSSRRSLDRNDHSRIIFCDEDMSAESVRIWLPSERMSLWIMSIRLRLSLDVISIQDLVPVCA